MAYEQSIKILEDAKAKLKDCYAKDIILELLAGNISEGAVGTLFRTLVLDEYWSVEDASRVYYAASELIEGPAGMVIKDVVSHAVDKASATRQSGKGEQEILFDDLPNKAWEDDPDLSKLYRETVRTYYRIASKRG